MATFYDIFRHLIVIFYLTYLSKAFGTVDHIILIAKLENYGNKGINLLWFKSYLILGNLYNMTYQTPLKKKHNIWCSTRFSTWAAIISYLYKWSLWGIKHFRLNYVRRWHKSFLFSSEHKRFFLHKKVRIRTLTIGLKLINCH